MDAGDGRSVPRRNIAADVAGIFEALGAPPPPGGGALVVTSPIDGTIVARLLSQPVNGALQ